jgi:proteasome lid subunit RPN8/RPN11
MVNSPLILSSEDNLEFSTSEARPWLVVNGDGMKSKFRSDP